MRFILWLFGKKKILCVKCKQLKTVPKNHHWLKMCLDCKKRFDDLTGAIKNIMGLPE